MEVNFSMSNLSLKRKIWIAIALISLIPLVVFTYYISGYQITFWATVVLLLVIVLGWWTVVEVFKSIIKIYTRSKTTLEDIGESTPVAPNEVQSLENVIGLLSDKVKNSFEQLQDFTRMTADLNKEVSKKVLILSTILQANDLFSKNTPAEDVIKFISHHLKQLMGVKLCFCGLREGVLGKIKVVACEGADSSVVEDFLEDKKDEFPRMRKIAVLDKNSRSSVYASWAEDLGVNNFMAAPIVSKGQVVGLVGVGDGEEKDSYDKDDEDVINLFSQNVTLIWEHETLSTKIEELEIMDDLTGLYNERMMVKRLEEEIRRSTAYQRPCGFVAMKIINFDDYQKKYGLIEAEKMLKKIAKAFKGALRAIDIAGRISSDVLGAVLIENNKRQSKEVAAALKKKLAEACGKEVKLLFSVAESPVNGTTAKELMEFINKPNSI